MTVPVEKVGTITEWRRLASSDLLIDACATALAVGDIDNAQRLEDELRRRLNRATAHGTAFPYSGE